MDEGDSSMDDGDPVSKVILCLLVDWCFKFLLQAGDGDCAVTVTEEPAPAKDTKVIVVLVCHSVLMCLLCRVKSVFVPKGRGVRLLVRQPLVIVTVLRKLRYV